MRSIIVTFICLFMIFEWANAQKIKRNEVDKFTIKHVIETSFERIHANILNNRNVWIALKNVDGNEWLRLKWSCDEVLSVDKGAEVIFLDHEENTYIFKNTKYTLSGKGEGTIGLSGSAMYGLDLWLKGDISMLENRCIKGMRIYTNDGYVDFKISESNSKKISKTYKVYKKAVFQ